MAKETGSRRQRAVSFLQQYVLGPTREYLPVFSGVTILGVLATLFYLTPIRDTTEEQLFDLRTRIKVNTLDTSKSAVIGIYPEDLPNDGNPGNTDLPFSTLIEATKKALAQKPKVLLVFWYPQVFPVDAPEATQLIRLARENQNLYLGIFEKEAMAGLTAEKIQGVQHKLLGVYPPKRKIRGVARWIQTPEFPILNPAPLRIAQTLNPELKTHWDSEKKIWLNLVPPEQIPVLSLTELLEDKAKFSLQDRIVALGYNFYRRQISDAYSPSLVNTSLQSENNSTLNASPLTFWHVGSILNLTQKRWLEVVPVWVNILQIVAVSLLTLLAWQLGLGLGSLAIASLGFGLLILHSLAMGLLDIYLPLADPFLFVSFIAMLGGLVRSSQEVQQRALMIAKAEGQRTLGAIHDRFLTDFATSLIKKSSSLQETLASKIPDSGETDLFQRARKNALQASVELSEYLEGFRKDTQSQRKHPLKYQKITPWEITTLVQREFKRLTTDTDHQLQTHQTPPDSILHTDPQILFEILANLLSNAIKYSPKDSTVSLEWSEMPGHLVLSIIDQGSGIPKEHQELIFEKYYRIQDDNVHKVSGHGLGLYLCRYFAFRLGARLTLESSSAGSRFSVILPRENPHA